MGFGWLPFGETNATAEEISSYVDFDIASRELEARGVTDGKAAVDAYLQLVPDLLTWLGENGRDYPWRKTTDPWRVYVTEILLQRTRSDAVADIWEELFNQFSSPEVLLDASEVDVREIVHPLGFVNHRVRTLREAAHLCAVEYDGEVPDDIDALQRPWRVGPYTARATLMFAFHEPLPLVDTNTVRIVSRIFDYPLPRQPHKSERVYRLMSALTPEEAALARSFNLALLDLGALLCTNESPDCQNCHFNSSCIFAETFY